MLLISIAHTEVRSEGKSPPRNSEKQIFPTFSLHLLFPECQEKSSSEVQYNGLRDRRLQWRWWSKLLLRSSSTGGLPSFHLQISTILYFLMGCIHPSLPDLQFPSVGFLGSKSAIREVLLIFFPLLYFEAFSLFFSLFPLSAVIDLCCCGECGIVKDESSDRIDYPS